MPVIIDLEVTASYFAAGAGAQVTSAHQVAGSARASAGRGVIAAVGTPPRVRAAPAGADIRVRALCLSAGLRKAGGGVASYAKEEDGAN